MSDTALIRAILSDPDDDTARLAYADWLDENGQDAARAEFIRVQVELARLDSSDPRRDALEDRENELLRAHEAHWLGDIPTRFIGWRFERGFLAELASDTKAFREAGSAAFDRHPITRIRVEQPKGQGSGPVKRLAAADWLTRVRELGLDNWSLSAVRGITQILTSPKLAGLTSLDIARPGPAAGFPELLRGLACFPGLRRLRLSTWNGPASELVGVLVRSGIEELRLDQCSLTPADLAAIVGDPFADRLTRFEFTHLTPDYWPAFKAKTARPAVTHLTATDLGDARMRLAPLLDARGCRKLVSLDLNETHVRREMIEEIPKTAFWPRCRELKLLRGNCPPETMAKLVAAPAPNDLRVLRLGETGLRDAGVRHLCSAAWADNLRELDLMRNYLSDDALRLIADSGRFVNLQSLDIRTNGPKLERSTARERVTDAGMEVLANAPNLARLRQLNLHATPITARGVDAIINGPHWKLADLDIGGSDIGPDAVRVLAASPNLARLTRLSMAFVNGLKEDALLPLAESPYLSPLCELDVRYYQLSKQAAAAFQARLGSRLRS